MNQTYLLERIGLIKRKKIPFFQINYLTRNVKFLIVLQRIVFYENG